MPEVDRQLVQRITERVLHELSRTSAEAGETHASGPEERHQGGSRQPLPHGHGSSAAPVPVHPAIGVCTGDYRQFTDRPDLVAGGNSQQPTANGQQGGERREPPGTSQPGELLPQIGPVLSGFVTAKQVDAVPGDKLLLDAGAKLTPLAQDRVRERAMTVRRASPLAGRRNPAPGAARPGDSGTGGGVGASPWLWWIDGHCPSVHAIVGERHDRMSPAGAGHGGDPVASVVMRIARAVGAGHAPGAILFVRSAAAATCFANRCRPLRAVVATCPEAVVQGVSELAANVLIIEYPYHNRDRMGAMVDRFINAPRPNLPDLEQRLRELEQCA